MSDEIRHSPFHPQITAKTGEQCHWGRLYGSSKSLVISRIIDEKDVPVIVVTKDSLQASRFTEELKFYTGEHPENRILTFPDWETLPYDLFSPFQDIISERLATLASLASFRKGVLVVPVTTVMHRLLPKAYLNSHCLMLSTGQQLDINVFKRDLISAGYRIVAQVMEHGDSAVRGSLIDIFPMGAKMPFRIDMFDDEIDSIRIFDPETQRSLDKIENINILPAKEVALTDAGIAKFRASWREKFAGNPGQCPVYHDVSQGLAPAGIEYYLPLFYQETNTLFDYIVDEAVIILDEDIRETMEGFWNDIEDRYEQGRHDIERPLLPPGELYLNQQELFIRIKPFSLSNTEGLTENTPLLPYALCVFNRPPT